MTSDAKPIRDKDFIIESKAFDQDFNVSSLDFRDIMTLLVAFTKEILLSEAELDRMKINRDLRVEFKRLISEASEFVKSNATADKTKSARVRAWKLHDALAQGSETQCLAEIVVLCTYDQESAEFDTFGSEPMIESILTSLARLGPGYCRRFRIFSQEGLQ